MTEDNGRCESLVKRGSVFWREAETASKIVGFGHLDFQNFPELYCYEISPLELSVLVSEWANPQNILKNLKKLIILFFLIEWNESKWPDQGSWSVKKLIKYIITCDF